MKGTRQKLLSVGRVGLVMIPWMSVMYTLYWIDQNGVWDSETPHRDIMSGAMVAAGMLATFLLYTFLKKRMT